MPVITYNPLEGALTVEQKEAIIQGIKKVVGDVAGEKIKKGVWVIINESPEGYFAKRVASKSALPI